MKTINICIALVFIISLSSCSVFKSTRYSDPEILINHDFTGNNIAVLNFKVNGSFYQGDASKMIADKFTQALFLKGHFKVIDHSKVNAVLANLKIDDVESLTKDQITKIGSALEAEYIIVGKTNLLAGNQFYEVDNPKELQMSFRIISTTTTDVVGVGQMSCKYKTNSVEKIDTMINEIVQKMTEGE